MPRSISAWDTTTCALPSPESRLDMPTSAMPTCSHHSNPVDVLHVVTYATLLKMNNSNHLHNAPQCHASPRLHAPIHAPFDA